MSHSVSPQLLASLPDVHMPLVRERIYVLHNTTRHPRPEAEPVSGNTISTPARPVVPEDQNRIADASDGKVEFIPQRHILDINMHTHKRLLKMFEEEKIDPLAGWTRRAPPRLFEAMRRNRVFRHELLREYDTDGLAGRRISTYLDHDTIEPCLEITDEEYEITSQMLDGPIGSRSDAFCLRHGGRDTDFPAGNVRQARFSLVVCLPYMRYCFRELEAERSFIQRYKMDYIFHCLCAHAIIAQILIKNADPSVASEDLTENLEAAIRDAHMASDYVTRAEFERTEFIDSYFYIKRALRNFPELSAEVQGLGNPSTSIYSLYPDGEISI